MSGDSVDRARTKDRLLVESREMLRWIYWRGLHARFPETTRDDFVTLLAQLEPVADQIEGAGR